MRNYDGPTVFGETEEDSPVDTARFYTVTASEDGKGGAAKWTVQANSPLQAVEQVLKTADSVVADASPRQQLAEMGQYLLELACLGGMPDTYFFTDARIKKAAEAMGMSVPQAFEWVSHL